MMPLIRSVSLLGVPTFPTEIQHNPRFLVFQNVIYNLADGTTKDIEVSDYIVETLDWSYDEANIDPTVYENIKASFTQVFNDNELLTSSMLMWLAYNLTGETREDMFMVHLGSSAGNGKSTLSKVFEKCFGMYHVTLGMYLSMYMSPPH
ncbi:hypothetical protein KIPB_014621 [Kipferlia bialata]|uniref:Bacteriophage/plasmid primase P4 C-terminal domain-containing protein n=1 Tax=Kipferlia bialata TaxID=797122 RepID=A0A391NVF5_9EUKA|nr:hypothetical protein KIPB_014621 [Kipferlia bialata]|eukprot:g14621.t1